ncbi:MAG: FeoB-associated Cys-rich membrane protein [Aquificae bacterium]|nr:FeoB-associated Cys-rich membrane protein [Aquificota bacterium]
MEYILTGVVLLISVFYLYRRFKDYGRKGQCASCPFYGSCDFKDRF